MTISGFRGADRRWALAWFAMAPLRWTIRQFPTRKGRGRLAWLHGQVLSALPAAPNEVLLSVPSGTQVPVDAASDIGRAALAQGFFEAPELELLTRLCVQGTCAIDVGANVGLFTVAFAQAVGPTGVVLSVEPYAPSVTRLRKTIETNALTNVRIAEVAVGNRHARGKLTGSDPALLRLEFDDNGPISVTKLDDLWTEFGRPTVSVLKIDVEGMQEAVLEGAAELLSTQPHVLVEAHTRTQLARAAELLAPHGLRESRRRLDPWNHFFTAAVAQDGAAGRATVRVR